MSKRTFRYIQEEDVLKSFIEFRDAILDQRPVVIARHGDYALLMFKKSENELGLRVMNDEKKSMVSERFYNIDKTTKELVARGVRHGIQKISELSDEDVNNKRFQIWKWHVIELQSTRSDFQQGILYNELTWDEEHIKTEKDLIDMEVFLHGEYLNMGSTLALIDKYLTSDEHKEMFRKFAVADIMEMTSEDTRDRAIEEAEKRSQEEELKLHTYQFTVSVEATDKERARHALLSYLAGDSRISVSK